jgi:hypothetical protein
MAGALLSNPMTYIYFLTMAFLFIGALWELQQEGRERSPRQPPPPSVAPPVSDQIARRLPRVDSSAPLGQCLYAPCPTCYHTMFEGAIKKIHYW